MTFLNRLHHLPERKQRTCNRFHNKGATKSNFLHLLGQTYSVGQNTEKVIEPISSGRLRVWVSKKCQNAHVLVVIKLRPRESACKN